MLHLSHGQAHNLFLLLLFIVKEAVVFLATDQGSYSKEWSRKEGWSERERVGNECHEGMKALLHPPQWLLRDQQGAKSTQERKKKIVL